MRKKYLKRIRGEPRQENDIKDIVLSISKAFVRTFFGTQTFHTKSYIYAIAEIDLSNQVWTAKRL